MSKYYHTCPKCGANLDPGERCDCENETEEEVPKCLNTSTTPNATTPC